mgnify:FL=1
MISNVTIKNYKSVVDVSLPLGRFNLLIGANGCGKSNILEGLAMAAAARADKLDFEYFANRGIRVTDPKFMLPAFGTTNADKIEISVLNEKGEKTFFDIHYNNESKPPKWEDNSMNTSQLLNYIVKRLPKDTPGVTDLKAEIERIGKNNFDDAENIRFRQTDKGIIIFWFFIGMA